MEDRRSVRLIDYDYAAPGAYFITVCADQRRCTFGCITDGVVELNVLGLIVCRSWLEIPNHFPDVQLDVSVVMPNHLHAVLFLWGDARATTESSSSVNHGPRATHASPLHGSPRAHGTGPRSVGAIVGAFKSAAARRINVRRGKQNPPVWQRNYYEHVIRNDEDLNRIRQYIIDNPRAWDRDPENPNS